MTDARGRGFLVGDAASDINRGNPRLVMIRGKSPGRVMPLEGESLVLSRRQGKGALNDPEVSSRHAEIVKTPAGYLLRDLRSTNGTFLNGRSIKEALLSAGDELVVGRTVLRWEGEGVQVQFDAIPDERGSMASTMEFRGASVDAARRKVKGAARLEAWAHLAELDEAPVIIEERQPLLKGAKDYALLELKQVGTELKVPVGATLMLEVVEGPEKGRVVTFTRGEMTIGRYGTDCVIKDSDISRAHATFFAFGQDQIFIRDLGSTNGTFVNGVRVRFSRIQSGDTLVIGRSLIHLVIRRAS